ncbi:TolB family protein [Costertonia aggregata]|uniref:PD40 domain-containing protein n=1 Tax=Costertonia aggregata TaxID=343403 RepID=A0A7H9AN48_9FLAO|nr:PD40 domain-containing protein [Costertonia aggregata]QLG44705.1 PD40 domain-containing protein [Costertonia aggregata]
MKKTLYFILATTFSLGCSAQQKIAYNVLEDAATQDYEIYVMDTEGNNSKNISNSKSVDWVYDSFGDKIYFLSDRGECFRCFYLYEMDSNGNNLRKITDFKLGDSWLSTRNEGKEFIVKPAEAEDASFYIIDSKGTIIEKIKVDLTYANDPTFSPNGEKIVFRGSDKKSPRELGFTDALYVMDLSSKKMKKITSHPDENAGKQWTGYLAAAPRWRADGKISFASKRDNNYDIYIINPDGTEMTSVTPLENNQVYHHWSADGELIFEASMNNHNGYELYKRTKDGKTVQLTEDKTEQYAPVFVNSKK